MKEIASALSPTLLFKGNDLFIYAEEISVTRFKASRRCKCHDLVAIEQGGEGGEQAFNIFGFDLMRLYFFLFTFKFIASN